MATKVYGIKNCNTVKKALDWLNDRKISYEFHDFKKVGVSEETLHRWASSKGWENLINKKGTTWKALPEEIKLNVNSDKAAFALMQDKISLIRRPVVEKNGEIVQGYDEKELERLFK